MRSPTWKGVYGWVDGLVIFRLVHHTTGWRIYYKGDPLDGEDYVSEDKAKEAAEAAADGLPDPQPAPPPRQRRIFVRNEGPGWAPHPGTLLPRDATKPPDP